MDALERVVDIIPQKHDKTALYTVLILIPVLLSVTVAVVTQISSIRLQDERISRLENWKTSIDESNQRIEENILILGEKLGIGERMKRS